MYKFSIIEAVKVLSLGLPLWLFFFAIFRARFAGIMRYALGATALLIFCFFALFWRGEVSLGETNWWEQTPFRQIIFFFIMILGMCFSVVYAAICERRRKKAAGKTVSSRLEIDIWDIVQPLLLSVLTYGALNGQLAGRPFNTATVVLSFQTGFFWQTVVDAHNRSRKVAK